MNTIIMTIVMVWGSVSPTPLDLAIVFRRLGVGAGRKLGFAVWTVLPLP